MPAFTEILSSDNVTDSFTVDTSGPLEVTLPAVGAAGLAFSNAGGSKFFEPRDNVIIQNIWCNIPFGFGQGTAKHLFDLVYDQGGINFAPPELDAGRVIIPSLCGPLPFPPSGLLLRPNVALVGGRFFFKIIAINLNISMVGVPQALNGQTIFPQYHLQIQHTRPLSPIP